MPPNYCQMGFSAHLFILNMSNSKRTHQQMHNSKVSNTATPTSSNETYDTTFFPLPETRFPLGTPIHSKRSRKFYSDLSDEREFLLHIKELWKSKLTSLKEDKKLLETMKDIKKQQLNNVEPLFCPDENAHPSENELGEEETNVHDPTSVETDETENHENEHDPFKIIDGQVVVKDPSMLATLQELDRIYSTSQDNVEDQSSDEEPVEEDDEQARSALYKMLEEFGGGF